MLRSLLTTLTIVTLCASARAVTFSNASLNGTYGFVTDVSEDFTNRFTPGQTVESLTLDGAGGATATRRVFLAWGTYAPPLLPVEQQGAGTYAVSPEGLGTIALTWTPALDVPPLTPPSGGCVTHEWWPSEVMYLTLEGNGFSFVRVSELRSQTECTGQPPVPHPTYQYAEATAHASLVSSPCDIPAARRPAAPLRGLPD